ncbi:MAG: tetratricopeptide repeat protein [Verrucomicrobia bacterium]|nr:tetratricopeptide repeat protein [Verrucomicrobiota bacterium]
MSRFSNLEFQSQPEEESQGDAAVKDEAYYLAEARAGFEAGRFEGALRSFSKVLEFNPQNTGAWSGQVRMLIELQEYREAKIWADKALERFPHDPELLAAKAVALGRLGDLKAALAFSDAAIEERGETPYVWLARGDVLLARRERHAEFCFERAVGFAPRDWLVHWLASRVYYFYEKFSLALKLASQALALETSRAVLWLQVGYCQQALGLIGAARSSFEQAQQLSPVGTPADQALIELGQIGFWRPLWSRWRRWWNP